MNHHPGTKTSRSAAQSIQLRGSIPCNHVLAESLAGLSASQALDKLVQLAIIGWVVQNRPVAGALPMPAGRPRTEVDGAPADARGSGRPDPVPLSASDLDSVLKFSGLTAHA